MIAFYDLDRTLIEENSAYLYALFEKKHHRITARQFATSAIWMALYHMNLLDIDKAYAKAVASYKGRSELEVYHQVKEFFQTKIQDRLLPGAMDSFQEHRLKNHELVLLTNGSPIQAKLACEAWSMDDWLANHFNVDNNGRFLGTFRKPLCYGQGKVVRAKDYAESKGIPIENCTFFSDSYSDLPMLKAVGHPRVVNPDPKLRAFAKKHSWPVLDWRR